MVDGVKGNRVVKWITDKRWLLFFVAAIVLVSIKLPAGLYRTLSSLTDQKSVWSLPEDAVCLYPDRNLSFIGYSVEGNRITPVDGDPQIMIELQDERAQHLLIDLAEPVKTDTIVEIYFDDKTGLLSEDRKLAATVNSGESQMMVSLPSADQNIIRLDINGEVRLKGIYYSNAGFIESKEPIPLGMKKSLLLSAPCLLFFVAILLSMGLALFWKNGAKQSVPYIITAICRVWLGITAGVWYPQGQGYDDALIFHYTNFATYFGNTEIRSRDVMLKELGMPIVLNIINGIGISYAMFLSLLWVLDGILTAKFVRRINRGQCPKTEFLAFLFVLFQPIALEKWTGTRLYRNALLTPMYFLVFLLCLIILYNLIDGSPKRIREALFCSIPLGIAFALTYLIKEDGIWLLLAVVVLFIIMLFVAICMTVQKQLYLGGWLRVCLATIIPFVILFGSIGVIKQVNYNAFGVYATNARTAGEEGKFVTYVYKTASDDRDLDIWAPADAIKKIFNASETLNQNKALKKAVFRTAWAGGNIRKNPIKGDFLTWVIKDALFDSHTCSSKKEAEEYMKKVNQELDEAFKSGRLQVDPKIRLVSSLGGASKSEILELIKMTLTGYKDMLSTGIYEPGATIQYNSEDDTQFASIMVNQDLNSVASDVAVQYRHFEVEIANGIINTIFRIYDCIQPILFVLGILGAIVSLWVFIKSIVKRTLELHQLTKALLVLFFLALSFALLLSISWFTYYLHNEYFSYFFGIGALPLITLFEITGCSMLYDAVIKKGVGLRPVKSV